MNGSAKTLTYSSSVQPPIDMPCSAALQAVSVGILKKESIATRLTAKEGSDFAALTRNRIPTADPMSPSFSAAVFRASSSPVFSLWVYHSSRRRRRDANPIEMRRATPKATVRSAMVPPLVFMVLSVPPDSLTLHAPLPRCVTQERLEGRKIPERPLLEP